MEVFQLTSLQKQKTVQFETKNEKSLWSSYLLGLSFSFGWTPCVGPVLSSVLTLVATQQASVFLWDVFIRNLYFRSINSIFSIIDCFDRCYESLQSCEETIILIKESWWDCYYCNGCLDYYPTIYKYYFYKDRRMTDEEMEICIYWS